MIPKIVHSTLFIIIIPIILDIFGLLGNAGVTAVSQLHRAAKPAVRKLNNQEKSFKK